MTFSPFRSFAENIAASPTHPAFALGVVTAAALQAAGADAAWRRGDFRQAEADRQALVALRARQEERRS